MAAPDTIIDPDTVIRVGRASVDHGEAVRDAAALVQLGPTGIDHAAARAALVERTERLGARLRHNGRALEQLGREFRELDGAVSQSFQRLLAERWR